MLDDGCDDVLPYDDGNKMTAVMEVPLITAVTVCPLIMAEMDYP